MSAAPAVSVVVPVFNAAAWLEPCLASIAAQDFTDFELVLRDDGSSDGSRELLQAWARREPRIRLDLGERRLGAAGSSNRVIELARAPLVARLDADDRMLPGRLAAQVAAFAARPAAVLVGALAWTIDPAGRRVRAPDLARLTRPSRFAPFAHSSTMLRRTAWAEVGGYRAAAEKWEDVDLFLRLAEIGEVWTIAEALIEYRQNPATTRLGEGLGPLEQAMEAMCAALADHPLPADGKIAPAAYRHIGATLLWSGGRPRLLRRILHRARLGANTASAALLGWAAAAQAAPGLLRAALRADLARRNRRARQLIGDSPLVRWDPA
ncbi:MAG: glycosyltransferase family 2 protein [Novosphingobium sp.]